MRPKALLKALSFNLDEVVRWDFVIGLGFAAGGVALAVNAPALLSQQVVPVAATLVGVVIGAVIAAAAILGAFLDQEFLRKLKRIERDPVYYFAPFLFTAFLGVVGEILLLVILPLETAPTWLLATLAGFGGQAIGWTLGSLIYDLDMLVQFLQLQTAAADVEDEPGDGSVRRIQP